MQVSAWHKKTADQPVLPMEDSVSMCFKASPISVLIATHTCSEGRKAAESSKNCCSEGDCKAMYQCPAHVCEEWRYS